MQAKLMLGQVVMTREINNKIADDERFARFVYSALSRYRSGDWGDLTQPDINANDRAIASGEDRVFASYIYPADTSLKIWIITEWDRSYTTILFSDEY